MFPVYSDPTGGALKRHEPARIPWGVAVRVVCYAGNESGMSNINYFYKITGDPWDGDYAPANTFDNGAGMGPNAVDLDPRVLPCPQIFTPSFFTLSLVHTSLQRLAA